MIRKISDRAKPGSISLGLGEPDLPTPEVIRREAVRVIQEEKSGYTCKPASRAARKNCGRLSAHESSTSTRMWFTAGSQESLYLILRTLVEEGDEVVDAGSRLHRVSDDHKDGGRKEIRYRLPAPMTFGFDLDDFKRRLPAARKSSFASVHQIHRSALVSRRSASDGGCRDGERLERIHRQR
jgi:bifunctional pyridoxal-dependent enzyme with beta-cystathionase and maltose regulon repressor activities